MKAKSSEVKAARGAMSACRPTARPRRARAPPRRRVEGGGVVAQVAHLGLDAARQRHAVDGGAQRGLDAVLRREVEAAHGAGDRNLRRQHVVAVPAFDARDREHRRFARIDAARDDGVQLRDQLARGEDGVGRVMRLRRMAAAAAQHDVEAVGRRHDRAGPRLRLAERQVGPVVQRIDAVAGEAIEQAVLDHGARAALAFLGRLEDEVHRAVEAPRARQLARSADQHAGVAVVAAAVVNALRAAGMGGAPELDHRQRVHVGAQADAARAAAAAQRADHAGAAQAFMDLEAEQPQRLRRHAGRAPLLERELGMRVQVAAQRDQFGQQVGDRRGNRVQRQRPASTASASSASVWKW